MVSHRSSVPFAPPIGAPSPIRHLWFRTLDVPSSSQRGGSHWAPTNGRQFTAQKTRGVMASLGITHRRGGLTKSFKTAVRSQSRTLAIQGSSRTMHFATLGRVSNGLVEPV